jgi:CubicO group peptidase (beta-lactamase class C family)
MKIIILGFYFTILFLFQISSSAYSQQSKFNTSGPNAKVMGSDTNFSTCSRYGDHWTKLECRIGNISESNKVIGGVMRTVNPSKDVLNFKFMQNSPQELINKVDEYISKHPVMGFLVIKNGEIVVERYQYGRTQDMIFRGFSMSKTVTALLVGIAQNKGFINSLDDKVEKYWPEIKNSPYGGVTIKELLLMNSGVEGGNYDSDNANQHQIYSILLKNENYQKPEKFIEYLNDLKSRGTKGNNRYSNLDTLILGRVLSKATGKNISNLTSEWLWQPMGAKDISRWLYNNTDNLEWTESGFTSTLNDYGRLGVLLANNGKYKNTQVVPYNFLLEATDVNKIPKSNLQLSNYAFQYGYGYQTWVLSNKERTFCALGHYTQVICVQPSSKIVMIQVAANSSHDGFKKSFGSMANDIEPLWKEILKDLGGSND